MATKDEITNKIISIDTIIMISDYFENEKKHYEKLYEYDRLLNTNLRYTNLQHIYKKTYNYINYSFEFFSGEKTANDNYEWFIQKLNTINLSTVKCISISFQTSSISTQPHSEYAHKNIVNYIYFYEDTVYVNFSNDSMEEENYKIHSDIMTILNNCPPRYDKTIKYKFLRMQSLNLCIGFIFGYIALIALFILKNQIPVNIHNIIFSYNYVPVIIFLSISSIFGNIIGQFFNNSLFKNIIPQKKYSHYSYKQHQRIFVDNVDSYIKQVETQIGMFHNSIAKRKNIEKIFKKTLPIVFIHIIVCIVICLI
ncbi:MAG: hypothetical protein J6K42_01655 [Clostridia bacterium]|nr:hypothetical protein [Clostridia bacterium]